MEISVYSDSMFEMNKKLDSVKTGNMIYVLRKEMNMTQEELGKKVFVSRKAVSKWENGNCLPSIDTLKLLSITFGVSIDDLIRGNI